MADGLNRVMLLGNLGADPELRYTQGGQAILKLRLATTETYLDANKVRQERTEWHSVIVWGKRGEGLARVLNKGSRIFVEGGLRTSSYDDKDGNKRYRTEIVANDIILAGGGPGAGARRGPDSDEFAPPRSRPAPTGGGYGGPPSGGGYGGGAQGGGGGYGGPPSGGGYSGRPSGGGYGGGSGGGEYDSPASSDGYDAPVDDYSSEDDIPF